MIKNVNSPTRLIKTAAEIMAEIKRERRDYTRADRATPDMPCQWREGCDQPILAKLHCRKHYWRQHERPARVS